MRTVEHLIHTNVICVTADVPLIEAAELMLNAGGAELFVVAADGQLQGIVPDYVLLRCVLAEPLSPATVGDHACRITTFCTPTTTLAQAATILRLNVHARLPVIVNGKLLGVVLRNTLLQSLLRERQQAEGMVSGLDVHIPRPQFLEFPSRTGGDGEQVTRTNHSERYNTEPENRP